MMIPPSDTNPTNDVFNTTGGGGGGPTNPTVLEIWRERERRQRTVRVLLMFLLMLLLMDGEESNNNNHHLVDQHDENGNPTTNNARNNNSRHRRRFPPAKNANNLRGGQQRKGWGSSSGSSSSATDRRQERRDAIRRDREVSQILALPIWQARQSQEASLAKLTRQHERYQQLQTKNSNNKNIGGKTTTTTSIEEEVHQWIQAVLQASRQRQNLTQTDPVIALESDYDDERKNVKDNHENDHQKEEDNDNSDDDDDDSSNDPKRRTIWHYPWNATGFYRGKWTLEESTNNNDNTTKNNNNDDEEEEEEEDETLSRLAATIHKQRPMRNVTSSAKNNGTTFTDDNDDENEMDVALFLEPTQLEDIMLHEMRRRQRQSANGKRRRKSDDDNSQQNIAAAPQPTTIPVARVMVLPPGLHVKVRDDHNLTKMEWDQMTVDGQGNLYKSSSSLAAPVQRRQTVAPVPAGVDRETKDADETKKKKKNQQQQHHNIPLTRQDGRAAFQLYSRSIPGMKELSLVDGFVKLYDSNSAAGYTTRTDLLLRVRGVLIHAIGHLSLVSFHVPVTQTALVLSSSSETTTSSQSRRAKTKNKNRLLQQTQQPMKKEEKKKTRDESEQSPPPPKQNQPAGNENQQAAEKAKSQQTTQPNKQEAKNNGEETTTSNGDKAESEGADVDAALASEMGESSNKSEVADTARRRLQEALTDLDSADMKNVVKQIDDILDNHDDANDENDATTTSSEYGWVPFLSSFGGSDSASQALKRRRTSVVTDEKVEREVEEKSVDKKSTAKTEAEKMATWPKWSNVVIPFPFVHDDEKETIRKTRTPGSRRMPQREQLLESNSMDCAFEMALDIQETEWTFDEYRTLLKHKWNEHRRMDPHNPVNQHMLALKKEQEQQNGTATTANNSSSSTAARSLASSIGGATTTPYRTTPPKRKRNNWQDQALVVNMVGSIVSEECQFRAHVNVTALRTDWERTQSKAINYSFYMMLVCLVQIILLLRQLLHSQTQSAATRVSMICIGWQTVLDALICLGHIYLCLAMQPLFTAFASVAFFKCLIFCVIEMKYMAIIIQARNSANGGQPTDVLRRQVAILHLRFYLALLATFVALFYVGETYRWVYMMLLYSFWVPQIILNVITEAKTPMHRYYIYGMSMTRLVVPLYVLSVRKNFLREAYPEAPYHPILCRYLALWVGIQTAILIGQSKYGARFWIPARFLPPKYDYSRPIPPAILRNNSNTNNNGNTASEEFRAAQSRASEFVDTTTTSSTSNNHHHATSKTTRNRMRRQQGAATTDETSTSTNASPTVRGRSPANRPSRAQSNAPATTSPVSSSSSPSTSSSSTASSSSSRLECSICYDTIDVMRQSYMLAPCDHLFHRDCLIQWMDVKMECPICRKELPAL